MFFFFAKFDNFYVHIPKNRKIYFSKEVLFYGNYKGKI